MHHQNLLYTSLWSSVTYRINKQIRNLKSVKSRETLKSKEYQRLSLQQYDYPCYLFFLIFMSAMRAWFALIFWISVKSLRWVSLKYMNRWKQNQQTKSNSWSSPVTVRYMNKILIINTWLNWNKINKHNWNQINRP